MTTESQAAAVTSATKRYQRDGQSPVVALDAVDVTIESGSFVAIMGASGSGKMRERARERFEDVAMSMGARARGRDGSGGLHERRRRPRGVPRRLKHGAIVPVGAPASRRRGPTRGPPRRGSPPGGGAAPEPRGRSERQTSRAEGRVASPRRPVGYDARAQPRHPDERIFEARWASCAGKILSAPTAPDFSPST